MKKNLRNKVILIIAVLLACLYGIFRIPQGVTGKALLAAMTRNIHLGLDLQGGVHLILEVKVAEAVSAETDDTIQSIEADLKKASLTFSQVVKLDPNNPDVISGEGASRAQASSAASLLESKYSNEYDIGSPSVDGTITLTMKPVYEKDLEQRTVSQAIETIRDRVEELGVQDAP